MAKTNNKGFSLIEIVIAVAILSILLTPIIRQFTNTMETSRKAKALQEANETAVYEVEEFQRFTRDELDAKYGSPTVHADLPVTLYDTSGTEIATDLTYSTYEYKLPDSVIGAKRDVYTNVVTLDDLSNKVRAYGGDTATTHYKVAYGLTETELANFSNDFKLTNEGSIVKYDSDGNVDAVVCTDKNKNGTDVSYVQNPNEVNLGNMHDLDKNSVALIMGGTSSYDSDAYSALFSKAMDHLRDTDRESWEQALLNVDNESILSQSALDTSDRLIKIYTDKGYDNVLKKDYYVVKVDVYYSYNYDLLVKETTHNFKDMITYTVFSQKFYTKEPPEIYFEYQPYCISGDSTNVQYKADDYILFDNHVDECKLYLYKPYKDQMNAGASDDDYDKAKQEGYVYYTNSSKSERVKIHLASKTNTSTFTFDQKGERTDTTDSKRIYIFTNLDVEGYKDGATSYTKEGKTYSVQFVSDAFSGKFDFVKGELEMTQSVSNVMSASYLKYPLGNVYATKTMYDDGTSSDGTMKVLYTLSEDTREAERLYTITVKMTPDKNSLNSVRLSGAKGAN